MSDPMSVGQHPDHAPKDRRRDHAPKDRRRDAVLVATGVAAVLLIWFALANLHTVTINFWIHDYQASLILVIVISGLLGAAIALLAKRRRGPGGTA